MPGSRDNNAPIISLVDVRKAYQAGRRQVQALGGIDLTIEQGEWVAILGPSGCGKSTLLRCFNRMNDLVDGVRTDGDVLLNGEPIFAPHVDVINLRKRVGKATRLRERKAKTGEVLVPGAQAGTEKKGRKKAAEQASS